MVRRIPLSSPPVVPYEPAYAQQRFAKRIRLAMLCGLGPLTPLAVTTTIAAFTHDRRWFFASTATLILAHGVVGFGLFLLCMEYAIQRGRLISRSQFLHSCRYALIALLANWPLFIAVIVVAWRWT